MALTKIKNFIENHNLTNTIKVILLLIILFLAYRLFINSHTINSRNHFTNIKSTNENENENLYEHFTALPGIDNIFGNVLSLMNQQNIPSYSGNTCTFVLDNIYRLDTLVINFNNNNSINSTPKYSNTNSIKIQFNDSNGNMRYLKGEISSGGGSFNSSSPPEITPANNSFQLTSIVDENGLTVYTSKIILSIGATTNNISLYKDSSGNGYIDTFGIYGGTRDLVSLTDYTTLCNNTLQTTTISSPSQNTDSNGNIITTSYDAIKNQDNYVFKTVNDNLIYGLKLTVNKVPIISQPSATPSSNTQNFKTTNEPFSINIKYNNKIYPNNDFTIKDKYIVRSDKNNIPKQYTYIYLKTPIIANQFTFSVQRVIEVVNNMHTQNLIKLNITSLDMICTQPQITDIANYKSSINSITGSSGSGSGGSSDSANLCPSVNELADTQSKTQQICDNLEYQDKVKSEKLRLERNKQYLLKLQDQQNQVDQLNMAIQELENSRQARAQTMDQVRVLQYQNQKAGASSVRDLANQRLQSQDNNQLYMDININGT